MATSLWTDPQRWYDRALVDRDGEKIGTIAELYLGETGRPRWVLVHVGLFGTRPTFVPVHGARPWDGQIRVPYTKIFVKDAPIDETAHESSIAATPSVSPDHDARLGEYYGLAEPADETSPDDPDPTRCDRTVGDVNRRSTRVEPDPG